MSLACRNGGLAGVFLRKKPPNRGGLVLQQVSGADPGILVGWGVDFFFERKRESVDKVTFLLLGEGVTSPMRTNYMYG